MLAAAPVWFVLAPLSIPLHAPVALTASTFQAVATWVFTVRASSKDARLVPWAWLLRGLATLAVPIALTSSLGYRAALLAQLAAQAAYVGQLAVVLGKPRSRSLQWCALGCALSATFVMGDLVYRKLSHALELDSTAARVAAIAALPFVALAWYLLAELVDGSVHPNIAPWWRRLPLVVVQLGVPVAATLGGMLGGFAVAWSAPIEEPGLVTTLMVLGMLAFTGGYLALHAALTDRPTWWRAVALCGMLQAPFVWAILFRPQFDSERWKRFAAEQKACDGDMAQDLAYSDIVRGKTRAEIEALLGPPQVSIALGGPSLAEDPSADVDHYSYSLKGGRPCRAVEVLFREGRATGMKFFMCFD